MIRRIKSPYWRAAFWAFTLVIGLAAIAESLLHFYPEQTLTGEPEIAFNMVVIPLLPGMFAGRIVFMNVQESGAAYAVSIRSEQCAILIVNWGLYFLLFSYYLRWLNKRKQRARVEGTTL